MALDWRRYGEWCCCHRPQHSTLSVYLETVSQVAQAVLLLPVVVEGDLELRIFCLYLPSAGIPGIHLFYTDWELNGGGLIAC